MDSITQAALGAAIGEVILGEKHGNKGAIAGAIIATIPDLDVVFHLVYSKLDMLSIHRGFSHSILFSILGALLIAFILSTLKPFQKISFKTGFIFSWLCLFTHSLLDTFTAYGTQLLLPFSDKRVGFDSINVVDPVYTLPLLIGVICSSWFFRNSKKRIIFTKYGLIFSSGYLLFTLIHKQFVAQSISKTFESKNISYTSLLTMPVGIANINWYGVAKSEDSIYMLKHSQFYKVENTIESFPIHDNYLETVDKNLAATMRWFAKGFYTVEKENDTVRVFNLQVDMRGILKKGDRKVPTAGYFKIVTANGTSEFSSGTVKVDQ